MARRVVIVVEPVGISEAARRSLASAAEVEYGPFDRAGLLAAVASADALFVRLGHAIDSEVIDAAPRLRAVASATTGLDHIDIEYAARRGVQVVSLKGETAFLRTLTATAEHCWGLLLATVRHIVTAHLDVCAGEWDRDRHRGHQLRGMTLGVVGYGRLGRMVAGYGRAFGMRVVAFDPYVTQVDDEVERAADLSELLAQAHVVTVHVPLTRETESLFDRGRIAQMREGAYFINTSRGAVVDEEALAQALSEGSLAGAGIDVVRDELHDPARSPLVRYASTHDNLVVTPHIGGATRESMEAAECFVAEKLRVLLEAGEGDS